MNEKNIRLVTAESVRASHPDKFCDQVADAILDAHLRQDPNARIAAEVFATAGKIIVGGEVTSKATVSYDKIVAGVINRIGYTMSDLCGDSHGLLELEVCLHEQSPDISAAVGKSMLDAGKTLGAGDQGIMVGYATNETEEYLPLPVVLAHRICKRLDELKPQTTWLGADGKAQVTVAYENDVPVAVTAVVVSLQHDAEIQIAVEVDLLAAVHVIERFRPDLTDLRLRQLPGVLIAGTRRFHRPEPAVARGVPQIARLFVGCAEEHALPQMRRGALAEGRTVDIVLP